MTVERAGDWMQTFSGKAFWPLDPRPEEIDIRDIAHALSMACRYAGHVRRFYSVAEHCVLLAGCFEAPALRKWALLHDASEAYLVDVPRPVKPFLAGYYEAEAKVMRAVCASYGLGPTMPEEVKDGDNRIILDEFAQAMAAPPMPLAIAGPPMGVRLQFWSSSRAEWEFLRVFGELFGERR